MNPEGTPPHLIFSPWPASSAPATWAPTRPPYPAQKSCFYFMHRLGDLSMRARHSHHTPRCPASTAWLSSVHFHLTYVQFSHHLLPLPEYLSVGRSESPWFLWSLVPSSGPGTPPAEWMFLHPACSVDSFHLSLACPWPTPEHQLLGAKNIACDRVPSNQVKIHWDTTHCLRQQGPRATSVS